MFFRVCDKVGRDYISHKWCNVDAVNGSVEHVMFGHDWGYRNFKICKLYSVMVR